MKSLLYHAFGVKGFRYLRTRYEGRAGLPDKRAGPTLSVSRKESDGRWILFREANMLKAV